MYILVWFKAFYIVYSHAANNFDDAKTENRHIYNIFNKLKYLANQRLSASLRHR